MRYINAELGFLFLIAIFKEPIIRLVFIFSSIDPPTTFREYKSITVVK